MMDMGKSYMDSDGNACNIWAMVHREPEWAAKRIQEGEAQSLRVAELEAERERRIKGMVQMCGFMQHKAACLSLNGDKNRCDCGMSMALMIAMNPHMDIPTLTESEVTND